VFRPVAAIDIVVDPDTRGLISMIRYLADTLFRYLEGGHYADASTIYESALRAAQRAGEDTMLASALTNLGALRRLLGDYHQAAGHLREAIDLHRRTGNQYGAARALSNLGIVQERLGEYEHAASLQREALDVHQRLGNRYGEAAARVVQPR
jgi:tetratricopeptide (TPR) repeat protein